MGFRWLRICVWFAVLAALCAIVWFNQIGLPDFLKTRLVAALHERGIDMDFSRLRLRFRHGLVAENVRINGAQSVAGPVLTLDEARLQLNLRALLQHWQLHVEGLFLRQGKLVWPLSPTNGLLLDNIQTSLRFQTNDTWTLDHFQADFAGAKLSLTGNLRHAPEMRNWEIFQGSGLTNGMPWQTRLQKFSDTLEQVHFTGAPQLNLMVSGDARDLHSFLLRVKVAAPFVQSPWFGAREIQLMANLTAPADVPTNFPAVSYWTNVMPYQLLWSVRATQLESQKINAAAVIAGGFWHAPELAVTNLSIKLGNGRLDAQATLNVVTRGLAFTNSSCFDVSALDALLTDKMRQWSGEISWSQPPSLQIGGTLTLPAWTNAQPDWFAEISPTAWLAGQAAVTNVTVHGTAIDVTQVAFNYSNRVWDFPDVAITQAKTRLAMDGREDDVTRNFRSHVRGVIDLESGRPFLNETNAAHLFGIVKLAEPLALDAEVRGRLFDWNSVAAAGQVALTNFSVRGQHFSDVSAAVNYTNGVLAFMQLVMHNGAQTGKADSITLDFNKSLIYFTNILSHADPEPVVRAIGPKTWKLVEPYHFLSPPTARVNGQIPLGDLHGGPEMAAVDMWFEVIKGVPFQWLKLKTTNIVGTLHWRGQTLLLTNTVAAFYDGTADGNADFDFRVPHEGGDYHFAVNVTNVNLHALMADVSSPTNSLEGTLAGQLVVTNASTENLQSWRGFGHASLQNGLLWNVPIISIVSPVLNTVSPGLGNSRATEATGKFRIANGVMTTDSLEIHSTLTRLEYVGTIDLQQNVNAHVTAHLLRDTWVVGPLVSTALWPVSKIFEYHVTGPLQNPKSEPLYVLPKLLLWPLHPIRTLENIFIPGGESYTNHPSGIEINKGH